MTRLEQARQIMPLKTARKSGGGYILNEEQYREYCSLKLIQQTKELRQKAKKRGMTQKKANEILSEVS